MKSRRTPARKNRFSYPNLPIFYLLARWEPETFGYVHYIDVPPDFADREDANVLRAHPPAVIVYMKSSEEDLQLGEVNFRGGHRSGQRDLMAAIDTLSPNYKILDSLIAPGTNRTVEVGTGARLTPGLFNRRAQ